MVCQLNVGQNITGDNFQDREHRFRHGVKTREKKPCWTNHHLETAYQPFELIVNANKYPPYSHKGFIKESHQLRDSDHINFV